MAAEARVCRICHGTDPPLASPCNCAGSLKWVHSKCLISWLQIRRVRGRDAECEVCRFKYVTPRSSMYGSSAFLSSLASDNSHYVAILTLPLFSSFGLLDSAFIRLLIVGYFYYSTLVHHNVPRFNHSLLHQYSIGLCVIMTAGFMMKAGVIFLRTFVWAPHQALLESFPLPEQLFRIDVDIHLFVLPVCLSNFLWVPLGVTSALVIVALQHLVAEFSLWALMESFQPHVRLIVASVYACVFLLYGVALAQGVRAWRHEWREDRTFEHVVRTLKDKEE